MYNNKRILAIIPARAGSKRLPYKNMRMCAGKRLINWTIETAQGSKYIDHIVITTDIKALHNWDISNVSVLKRQRKLCGDNVEMVHVVKDVVYKYPGYDILVLLQPTSPLRTSESMDECIETFGGIPLHSVREVYLAENLIKYVENGAIYIMDTKKIVFDDNFVPWVMSDNDSIDINTIEDFNKAEELLNAKL